MDSIKMLVFDVDGTLYDLVKHEIPLSAVEAIRKAKENGYIFVIATGRTHYGLGKALNDLQPDFILSASGGVVVDSQKNIIYHHDFDEKDVKQLLDFCHVHEAGLIFKFLDHMYIYQHPEKIDWLKGQMESDIGSDPFVACPAQDRHLRSLPQSASIHANPSEINKTFGNHSTIQFLQYSSDGYDVVPTGVNKGSGLKNLMKHLHLRAEQIACIGDNYNDLDMMKEAGYRIAMGNAVQAVKDVADYITSTTDQDGIYQALKHLNCI